MADPTPADRLLNRITKILAQYNNIESDIPVHDPYWDLINRYRHHSKNPADPVDLTGV
jgi:hypothetical protein